MAAIRVGEDMATEVTGHTPAPAAAVEQVAGGATLEEAGRAMEQARLDLEAAVAELAGGTEEQIARAYERAAGCTDHFARALWYLRRAEREGVR
jgi:hypothetical protein